MKNDEEDDNKDRIKDKDKDTLEVDQLENNKNLIEVENKIDRLESENVEEFNNNELIEILKGEEHDYINKDDNKKFNEIKRKILEEDSKYFNSFNETITNLQDKINEMINMEKENIKSEFNNIVYSKAKFEELKETEKEKYNLEKEKCFNNFFELIENNKTDILELNIGGEMEITTTRGTLTKFPLSNLGVMFSGKYKLPMLEDKIFVDRDPEPFNNLIYYLRTSKYPILKTTMDELLLKEELEYWGIPFEYRQSNNYLNMFDSDWCAPTLHLDNQCMTVKKNRKLVLNLLR